MMSWHGIWAAASTPNAIFAHINAVYVEGSKDSKVSKRIRDLNSEPVGVSHTGMASMACRDANINDRIVKANYIKID